MHALEGSPRVAFPFGLPSTYTATLLIKVSASALLSRAHPVTATVPETVADNGSIDRSGGWYPGTVHVPKLLQATDEVLFERDTALHMFFTPAKPGWKRIATLNVTLLTALVGPLMTQVKWSTRTVHCEFDRVVFGGVFGG